jgi:group I intron endonuclease
MKKFYIYTILNLVNYKMYVGQTANPKGRWSAHKCEVIKSRKNYPIYLAIRKYDIENFQYCIIDICETSEQADKLEIEWIENLQTRKQDMGYNLMLGGQCGMRGRHHTEDHKKKMHNLFIGRKMSDESRKKLSESKKGQPSNRKGAKFSDESKMKLSKSKKGQTSHRKGLTWKDVDGKRIWFKKEPVL